MQPTYIVYADVLFLTNFFLDYGILWATAKFGHIATSHLRLFLGALLGALYGVLMVYPQTIFLYAVSVKILFSLLIVAVSFPRLTVRKFLQATAYFYVISFAMAGAVLGGSSFLAHNSFFFQRLDIKTTGLLFGAAMALFLGYWGFGHLKRHWQRTQFRVSLEIMIEKKSLMVEALIDTGNELRDPLSQKPVIIVEYQALRNILPADFRQWYEKYGAEDVTKVMEHSGGAVWTTKVRMVPFNSIGKHHGILLGYKPDLVTIFGQQKTCTKDVIICLYHKPLSTSGGYRAVLNPEVFEAAA
ncbi:sigma-E processing peptidase SpoIIGA [Candidatus Formimonas warabiya]|uniref:Sporulation sigma-E factor-processing peptidase n=1 Tax=Formimonas warabiya TaxID=1761012 RepID=A0A3G1KRI7_FORW1|nr:sigma-E processing peptidase SpoIIGA [Candidatus Formimonas warabiya]ATW25050.1 sigma-E processing peptidase SpoIIGA [Candidatus Formimonas warabiya]